VKTISLDPWQEIVGRLTAVNVEDDVVVLTMTVSNRQIKVKVPNLPIDPQEFLGKLVGLLRTDDPSQPFVLRRIKV